MDLTTAHRRYVQEISAPEWAISFEASSWISAHCFAEKEKIFRACDLGSGFTSWVLRTRLDCPVDSVDHNAEWLGKTKDWLEAQGTRTDGLMTWEAWQAWDELYDLIVCDLGGGRRGEQFPGVLDRLRPGGVVLVDDMHRPQYNLLVQGEALKRRMNCVTLGQTLDGFGRFSAVVTDRVVV